MDIAKITEFDCRQLAHKPQIEPTGKAFDMDIRFAFDLVDDQRQACRTIAKILDRRVAERYLSIASADKFDAGYLVQARNVELAGQERSLPPVVEMWVVDLRTYQV